MSIAEDSTYFTRVVAIPSSVLASAMFGGSYGSGREVVEFLSRYGPGGGLLALMTVLIVFGASLFLCFEISRIFRAYDYHAFARVLLRAASPLYEIALLLALLLTLAINATGTGSLIAGHFGAPPLSTIVAFLVLVAALTLFGRRVVEASMVASFVALLAVLAVLCGIVAVTQHDTIAGAFAREPWNFGGINSGLSMALANAGLFPVVLFCGRGLRTRREVGVAATCGAIAIVVPAAIFHICFMIGYPQILGFELPTYWLIGEVAPAIVLTVYVAVLFWQMIQTGVAVLWGMLEAVNTALAHRGVQLSSPFSRGAAAAAVSITAVLLSSIGFIDLIIRRNQLLFVAFVLTFALPLATRGVWLVLRPRSADVVPQPT